MVQQPVSDEVIHFAVLVFNKHRTTIPQMARLPTVRSSKSFQLGKCYIAVWDDIRTCVKQ